MSQVTVSVAEMRKRLPEFADMVKYPQAQLEARLELAQIYFSTTNTVLLNGTARQLLIYLMCAHLQILSERITSGQTTASVVTSSGIGQVSISMTMPPSKTARDYWYALTIYGSMIKELLASKTNVGFFVGGESENVFK